MAQPSDGACIYAKLIPLRDVDKPKLTKNRQDRRERSRARGKTQKIVIFLAPFSEITVLLEDLKKDQTMRNWTLEKV